MTLEEKYGIVYVNEKRYYRFDVTESLPILDDAIPFYFSYDRIEVSESSWNKMALGILEALDKRNPKSSKELLSLQYTWSKTAPFSSSKRTNYTPFKDIYLNTNHTSTHSMMSIQCILKAYGIDAAKCYFLIRRHFICEPSEVREFIKNKTIKEFRNSLLISGFEKDRTETIIRNFDIINKYLSKVSPGFDDFFLFDDYSYFTNYRSKTLEYLSKKYLQSDKNYKVISRCLSYLDAFYKNREFFIWTENNPVDSSLIEEIRSELSSLFNKMDSRIILSSKLYSRMSILHKTSLTKLGKYNNAEGIYIICSVFLRKEYFYSFPYISKEQIESITNDQIIEAYARTFDFFSIDDVNQYIESMHLKKMDSYLDFIFMLSDEYIQVSQDVLMTKDKMNIDNSILNEIKKDLVFYINSFGPIDSETYQGYSSLPSIPDYEWNKFLLSGIANAYYKDELVVKPCTNNYKKYSFIIEKKEQKN